MSGPTAGAPSLQHVEHSLRSGNQAALRRELASAPTATACQLLHAFSLCASTISAEMHFELVETVLQLPWREDAQLASAVCEFVQDLVTASASFLRACVSALIESFLVPEGMPEGDADASAASATEEQVTQLVHTALQGILHACPLSIRCARPRRCTHSACPARPRRRSRRPALGCTTPADSHTRGRPHPDDILRSYPRPTRRRSHLHEAIKEHFPHARRDVRTHRCFLANTLKLLTYAPVLRPRTLHLVVERLVDLDVQITLQQRSLEEAVEEEADAIFEVELGDATAEEVAKMRKNAEKLDEVRHGM